MEEQQLVRCHPTLGSELLAQVPYLEVRRDDRPGCARAHGRPGASRAACTPRTSPLGARIVCVADAYDTMTRPRVFRDAIGPAEAMLELERCSGSQFDPAVVDAFRRVIAAL